MVCKAEEDSHRHTSGQFAVDQTSAQSLFVEADANGVTAEQHQNVALVQSVANDKVPTEPSLLMSNHSAYIDISQSDDDAQPLPAATSQYHSSLDFHLGE